MSDMRDARLKRALESAPDADLLPDRRVRQELLDAARKAVAPAPQAAWWKKLWQGLGDRRMPWNAALATVVLATLVTVLWHDREVPGVRPDSAQSEARAPATTAPTAAPPAAEPPTKVAPSEPAPVAPPVAAPARKPAPVAGPTPGAKPQPRPAQVPSQQAEAPRERRAERAAGALRDQATRDLAKSGPASQTADTANQAESAAAARAPAAAPAPAPAPSAAPAAAPPPLSRGGPAGLASQREPSAAGVWTHLRIEAQGRAIDLAREQAPRLAELVQGMARVAQGQEALEAPVTVRVELRRGDEAAGVIELAGAQVRWTRAGAGRSDSFTARPEPARLEAVREEVSRLLQR